MRYTRQPLPRWTRNAPDDFDGWGASGRATFRGDFLDDLEPVEPVPYDQFRVGLTFGDVARALDIEARARLEATGERMFITRRTVLGRLHQLKRETYQAYLREFGEP